MFLYLLATSVSIITFYNYNYISNKFEFYKGKWQRLNNLVSKKHDSKIMIWYCSICILIKQQYLNFLQYMNNSVVKIDKNLYEVSYIINDKQYKMLVKPSRGPKPYLSILDENGFDITEEIHPYLVPCHDFHNFKLTPKHISKKKIIVCKHSGNIDTFEEEEIIVFE